MIFRIILLLLLLNKRQHLVHSITDVQEDYPKTNDKNCFDHGCHRYARDIHHDDETKSLLKTIRSTDDNEDLIFPLTLMGYKGGALSDQINQDRAILIDPFRIPADDESEQQQQQQHPRTTTMTLMGVFDGHAKNGELVSTFVSSQISHSIVNHIQNQTTTTTTTDVLHNETIIREILSRAFIDLDTNAPAQNGGGTTASIILRIDDKLYMANAGDSRSFIASYTPSSSASSSSSSTEILSITREDKPHLPQERRRIEETYGGNVYIPPPNKPKASSRVMYRDVKTGRTYGLAMSRSIGDWDVGKFGVIPDPVVDVIDLNKDLQEICENEEVCRKREVFAVSATDGMLDYVEPNEVAEVVASSLYGGVDGGYHVLTACEDLIVKSADRWNEAKGGRYRDDIAIVVGKIKL